MRQFVKLYCLKTSYYTLSKILIKAYESQPKNFNYFYIMRLNINIQGMYFNSFVTDAY